jgi:protocatechuate 3,4-dioxygenase beta subunit
MARSRGFAWFVGLVVAVLLAAGLALWTRTGRDDRPVATDGRGQRGGAVSLFAPEPGSEGAPRTASIAGTVVDPEGKPVAGAAVLLTRTRGRDDPWTADFGRPIDLATTSADGAFQFEKLSAGGYAVSAMAAAGVTASQGPIEVAAGETQRIDLRLGAGGFLLHGRVLDVGGGAVPGAKVRALVLTQSTSSAAVPRVYQAAADDDGTYRLYLAAAQYRLTAEADGYATAQDFVVLTANTTRDLRLNPAARILGRVVERGSRKPVPEAELWLQAPRPRGSRPRDVKADAGGQFAFNDLDPGTYKVGARRGRLVGTSSSVSVATAQTAAEVEVEVDPGLVVAGRVTSRAGAPVAGARLQLFKTQPPFERPVAAQSSSDGSFRLEGLLPASFRLEVGAERHARSRQELRVTADVNGLELKLDLGGSVVGRVLTAQDKAAEGATVSLQLAPRGPGMNRQVVERATSGPDGTFTVPELPAGELMLTAQHPDHGVASVKDEKLAEAEHKVVTLKLAQGATVSGTVKLDDGSPAIGTRIVANRMGGGTGHWEASTQADGTYKLTGLTAGAVTVVASVGGTSIFSSVDRPDQKTVTVGVREHKTGVDLVVPGGRTISGVAVGPDGKPLEGAEITAGVERDGRVYRGLTEGARTFTGADGAFTLSQLGAGNHTLSGVHPGLTAAELKGVPGGATGIRLRFQPESTIAGVVTTTDGKPVSDYTIQLAPGPRPDETAEDKQRRQYLSVFDTPTDNVHDSAARFFFPGVSAGSYELRARGAAGGAGTLAVTVGAGERKQGVRVVIQGAVRIVGRVVERDSDNPLPNVEVRAWVTSADVRGPPATRTDGSGAFSVEAISPGDTLSLFITGDRSTHLGERRRVDIAKGGVIDLGTIKLMRGSVEARVKEGSWNGMTGINPSEDGSASVLSVRPGEPAALAGIKDGDAILAIDGKDMRGMSFGGIEYHLRGRPGSTITLTVQSPGGQPRTISFARYSADAPRPAPTPVTTAPRR